MKYLRNKKGQSMVEYALIVAVLAAVVLVGFKTMGGKAKSAFENMGGQMEEAKAKQP